MRRRISSLSERQDPACPRVHVLAFVSKIKISHAENVIIQNHKSFFKSEDMDFNFLGIGPFRITYRWTRRRSDHSSLIRLNARGQNAQTRAPSGE